MMSPITGVVQHYAWGDREAIPALLGLPADGTPWAEWWLGTHAGGPTTTADGRPLREVSGDLPYLVKLLAAATSLSLQTHPDEATARAGFDREHAAGLAIDDPRRIYRDPHAKPEMLCALTPFDALCGFRPINATLHLLTSLGATRLADHLREFGLAATVGALYRRGFPVDDVLDACATSSGDEATLVTRLAQQYPDDPSVVVTLLLNRVRLQPGEAILLGPGNLHAYLHGFGVEVMGASDNVVRGGLTPKHVDVDELLRVLSFAPLADPVLHPVPHGADRWHYPTPGAPFDLWRIEVSNTAVHRADSSQILLCTAGVALGASHAAYLATGEEVELGGPATVWVVGESATDG